MNIKIIITTHILVPEFDPESGQTVYDTNNYQEKCQFICQVGKYKFESFILKLKDAKEMTNIGYRALKDILIRIFPAVLFTDKQMLDIYVEVIKDSNLPNVIESKLP